MHGVTAFENSDRVTLVLQSRKTYDAVLVKALTHALMINLVEHVETLIAFLAVKGFLFPGRNAEVTLFTMEGRCIARSIVV